MTDILFVVFILLEMMGKPLKFCVLFKRVMVAFWMGLGFLLSSHGYGFW